MDDIANVLNVSKTAISFVLNGKAREKHISPESEKKILDYIEATGYQPNRFAQGLRTGKTQMIAMMVEDISDPFFSSIARLMEERAYKNGYKILYSSTENDLQKTRELIQVYRSRQVDGYIIAPPAGVEQELKELADDGLALVLFDRILPGFDAHHVIINNFESSYLGVRHLLQNGFEQIAMVTLDSEQIQMQERKNGYMQAVAEAKRAPLIKQIKYHEEKDVSNRQIKEFIIAQQNIDAIFFSTNFIACSGFEAIKSLNLRIPDDLGVLVFDDHDYFRLFTPSVSAIAQPIKEIAEKTMNILLLELAHPLEQVSPKAIILNGILMARDSSVGPNPRVR